MWYTMVEDGLSPGVENKAEARGNMRTLRSNPGKK